MNNNEYDSNGLDKGITGMNDQPKEERSDIAERSGALSGKIPLNNGKTKNVYHYLVTIKCHAKCHVNKYVLDSVLQETVKKLTRVGADWSSLVGYEEDSRNRMHLHTIVKTTAKVPMKKMQKPGWSIHFNQVENPKATVKYITKCGINKFQIEQRFDENFYKWGNRFPTYNELIGT